jgi:hypothetical protein
MHVADAPGCGDENTGGEESVDDQADGKAEWARNVKDRALLEQLLRDNFVAVVRKCSSRVPPP